MSTNIETNDELMRRALDLLVKIKGQELIREAFGTLPWDDDLEAMRLDREDPAWAKPDTHPRAPPPQVPEGPTGRRCLPVTLPIDPC